MRRRKLALGRCLALFVAALAGACGDDAGGAGGEAGAGIGGAGGAGGADGLSASDFVDPGSYDCRAGDASPPLRPYRFGCLHDAGCTSRFIAAHRMGTIFAPENSLSALRASIVIGADVAETDVRSTLDGRVVLIHDAEVDRTLDASGNVRDFTLAEIQEMTMVPKATDPPDADFSCDRAPTIEEALAVAAGKIVIEFETKETEAGILTAQYLSDNALYGSAYLQCAPEECDAIRAVVPDVPIMVRVTEMAHLDRVEAYDPPPILVEIDASQQWLDAGVLDRIHGTGAKAFTNAFYSADLVAFGGDYSLYGEMFDKDLQVLQTEFPHWALYGIGRASPLP